MQPSSQVVQMLEVPAVAKEAVKADKLPLLSLLTFSPMGNPLTGLSAGQCNLFFDYLLLSLHNQRKEQLERTAALMKRHVVPVALSAAAISLGSRAQEERGRIAAKRAAEAQQAEEAKKTREARKAAEASAQSYAASDKEERHKIALEQILDKKGKGEGEAGSPEGAGAAGIRFTSLLRSKDEGRKGGEEGSAGTSFSSAFGQKSSVVSNALGQLALVVDDYARGSEAKEKRVVNDLHNGLRSHGYQTDDLMASLLMVIEDNAWAGEEGGAGSAKPHGGNTRIAAMVPQKLRFTAQDSAVVRLASVREMLRYYFRVHPKDYHGALAAALGITADQEEDSTFLQERLASELAHIGGFALAQKLLAELKLRKKMDTEECLMRLGYRYDVKRKRLVLGKRTCGKPVEARGIVGLLLALARK